ncbi:MAG: hypothetical protein QOG93_1751 [Gaiellaceae bacterium]|nr:hypothetical protein [Gaiellaceae bacterium]
MEARRDISALVHPQLRQAFDGFPVILDASADPVAGRAQLLERFERFAGAGRAQDPLVARRDVAVPGLDDDPPLTVRVYEAAERGAVLPAILWIHGGGFMMGNVDVDDADCERLVREVEVVVVSVEYRLAPEHPFPAGTNDGYAALCWTAGSAAELGIDPARIAVAGRSSGGGTAAGVVLLARDRGEVEVAFQMPLYACLDDRLLTPSTHELHDPRAWNRTLLDHAWDAYLGPLRAGEVPPYAAPARAPDLAGLPPAYLQVGALDVLRDGNVEYAQRLVQAGVPTELHVFPGAFHGFDVLVPDAEISRRAVEEREAALRRALQP